MRRMLLILMIVIAVIAVALVGLRLGQSIAKMVMSRIAARTLAWTEPQLCRTACTSSSVALDRPCPTRSVPGPVQGIDQVFVVDTGSGSIGNLLRMGFSRPCRASSDPPAL